MSKVKLDHIVIVDVESTCWEGNPPPGQQSEIIQIGAWVFNNVEDLKDFAVPSTTNIYVKPTISTISEFCTELTGITEEKIKKEGVSFQEACAQLKWEMRTHKRIWASYGAYDRIMFQNQCQREGVKYPFSTRHLNIKTLFALSQGLKYEVGMITALEMLGIKKPIGNHHNAQDDACNMLPILGYILSRLTPEKPKE